MSSIRHEFHVRFTELEWYVNLQARVSALLRQEHPHGSV